MTSARLAAERVAATIGDGSLEWTPPLRTEDVRALLTIAEAASALLALMNEPPALVIRAVDWNHAQRVHAARAALARLTAALGAGEPGG